MKLNKLKTFKIIFKLKIRDETLEKSSKSLARRLRYLKISSSLNAVFYKVLKYQFVLTF